MEHLRKFILRNFEINLISNVQSVGYINGNSSFC